MKYDVVIIGSGLGGLLSGYTLAKEGYNVCIVEKHHQLGGCLQTFKRDGVLFDTGMHYIGGMDEGQVLHRYFQYFGLTGKLNLKRMDEDGYEIIRFKGKEYPYAMGYDAFVDNLHKQFPKEREALEKYVAKLKEISGSVDLYNVRDFNGMQNTYYENYSIGIDNYLSSLTTNEDLKSVLLGTLPLYSGVKNRTPLYIPLIIHNSYIEGAYRFVDGGSQISDLLEASLKSMGATILRKAEVTRFIVGPDKMTAVEINHQQRIEGETFISNIHPKEMLRMMDTPLIKKAYRNRIESIEETFGIFTLYLAMKEKGFKYINKNYYHFDTHNVWDGDDYSDADWPKGYMLHFSPSSTDTEYTDAIIVNTYMKWDEVLPWVDTKVGNRGAAYLELKERKAQKMLSIMERDFPGIRAAVKSYHTSTPLTYRDYTGTTKGSIYGVLKDYTNPLKTMILPRTKVPNLLLTGQNTNIHGVVGVTIGAIITCGELLGMNNLIKKMQNV